MAAAPILPWLAAALWRGVAWSGVAGEMPPSPGRLTTTHIASYRQLLCAGSHGTMYLNWVAVLIWCIAEE